MGYKGRGKLFLNIKIVLGREIVGRRERFSIKREDINNFIFIGII